jgi:hypothetical protein
VSSGREVKASQKIGGPAAASNGLSAVTAGLENDCLSDYLRTLAGRAPASAFLELRHRVADHSLAAEFLPAHDRDGLATAIRARARSTDVYIGCAPRSRRSGTKKDVDEVWVLWAECDGAAAARAALGYTPQPPVVVASGSGPNLHAYWPLHERFRARHAELANLRLAHALGADLACYDAARILRPPGTWNHKRRPPARVDVVRMRTGIAFGAEEVVERAPDVDIARIERRWNDRGQRDLRADPLLRIAPAVYVGDLLQVDARAGRKTSCPFHADERPSLHVYPTAARGWSCFSCGRGGSIYDLAGAVWGIGTRGRDFIELRRRLTERFGAELNRPTQVLER